MSTARSLAQFLSMKAMRQKTSLFPILLLALFASGVSGLINQVAWQRALKLYLGGSETISALIVVLVFMVGLGIGSLHMGLRIHRIKSPARVFAICEVVLVCVNLLIAGLASLDMTASIYAVQRLAMASGVPLRLVYGVSALAILFVPCYVMGLTMPLASEVAQRDLGRQRRTTVDVLFGVNTLGAVLGAIASGFWLLPYYGQVRAMLMAAACNGVAGMLIYLIYRRSSASHVEKTSAVRRSGIRSVEWMGFLLGFFSLAYEMLLYRIVPLAHEPLPYTFSVVLCGFLLLWSIGVLLAAHVPEIIVPTLMTVVLLIAALPWYQTYDRLPEGPGLVLAVGLYCLPCIGFGLLFGQVLARNVENWGTDVGRYYALNTFGSFLGILAMTILGFELYHQHDAWLIAGGFVLILLFFLGAERRARGQRVHIHVMSATLLFLGLGWLGIEGAQQPYVEDQRRVYSGRDGVVEIVDGNAVIMDGLWHSALSDGKNHIYSANWQLAALPYLCHPRSRLEDACVIGLGTGITVATLAEIDSIENITAYEINRTLARVYSDYPEGTLQVASHPKVEIRWQDGRSGLALDTKKYDLIIQQPLYLKQAGSSILLSREYLQLLYSRIKDDGIVCIYSNGQGRVLQALLVRKTASEVFPYYESFNKGYMLVLSKKPIRWSPASLKAKFTQVGEFFESCRRVVPELWDHWIDRNPKLNWKDCPYVITDDHPIVEYPEVVERLIGRSQSLR